MMLKILGVLCVVGLAVVGCGSVEQEAEQVGTSEAALTTFPLCCTSVSTAVPESFCDSVAYSPDRCNLVNGGGSCKWTCTSCCVPLRTSVSESFCAQYASFGPDRCNLVNGGGSCGWACP